MASCTSLRKKFGHMMKDLGFQGEWRLQEIFSDQPVCVCSPSLILNNLTLPYTAKLRMGGSRSNKLAPNKRFKEGSNPPVSTLNSDALAKSCHERTRTMDSTDRQS